MARPKKLYQKFYVDHNGVVHHGTAIKSKKNGYFIVKFNNMPEKEIVLHRRFILNTVNETAQYLIDFWQTRKAQAIKGIQAARIWKREFYNRNCPV